MSIYSDWIAEHYPTADRCKNKCNEATRRITEEFPELTVQVGRIKGIMHCWARTAEGVIIDPSVKQFKEPVKYELIAERFLKPHEYESSTGAIFLDDCSN